MSSPFRLVHLTDVHMMAERRAAEGFAQCLKLVQAQQPDQVLTGGDLVGDALNTDRAGAMAQWDLYFEALSELDVPVRNTLGNHDVLGWDDYERFGSEPGFGKALALDLHGMANPYYSFQAGGWNVIVLDSTHPLEGNGYTAKLDEAQFAWLARELETCTLPTLISSHIPIICACAMFDGENVRSGNWQIPGAWMHIDARRIKDLFAKQPQVKLAISGHIHLVDEVHYNGVTYCCNGAVSAGWWNGPYHECDFGYAVVDLWPDGRFVNRYVTYGWDPELVTLYRPCGLAELDLVMASGNQKWPPRLPEQPIFYPVTSEQYARDVNRWNVDQVGAGAITRFKVRRDFMDRYPVQRVGSNAQTEWWIPAEDLAEMNANIVGPIEVLDIERR